MARQFPNLISLIKQNYPFLLGLLLTLMLLWPLFYAPYFKIQDDVQNIRLYEMDKCIKDLQVPCRWVPDLGGEYGYPLYNYYAPLPYYAGEIFYLISHSLLFSTKAMFGLSFLLSYIFMFLLGRKLWGDLGGALSGVFYSFAPYHAVDFYVRGAEGEMWAMIFFPAIIWAILRLSEKRSNQNLVLLSILFACLILSHNLSAMIFFPIILAMVLILFWFNRDKKFLIYSGLSIVLGFLLSAFYFLPALVEKPLVHLETTIEGYFSYTEHFKGLQKLFFERYWGYGPSLREIPGIQEDNTFPYQIGIIHWLSWLFVTIGAFWITKKSTFKKILILLLGLVVLVSVFMINPRSAFVWKLIPSLAYLQFPWRFLEIIIFAISLVAGGALSLNIKPYFKTIIFGILIILVVALNFFYFRPEKFVYENNQSLIQGSIWDSSIKRSIFDYLPIYAKAPPAELATSRYQILQGQPQIMDFKEGTNWMKFNLTSDSSTVFRWSQYYFPDWKVFVDGSDTSINYQNPLGLITFNIPSGYHRVNARLDNTPVRTAGNTLTILGLLTSLYLLFFKKPKNLHSVG